ncbi:universal stress protein [Vulgatibacter incomptus]|uniref:universal stress protein n=1 Tax=Vulgatibacter incomptus TaxID=1391653 RepID=UPI0006828D19|nr:universal stress protein [Vulgatibacter incomptus]
MIDHVLVAIDGSEGARRAADFARELATQVGAKLTVLLVLEPIPMVSVGFGDLYGLARRQPTDEELDLLRTALDRAADGFPGEVEKVIEYGPAAETICQVADQREVGLIVVGARGLGTVGRFLIGSVSDRVVHLAKRNVAVVH